MSPCRTGPALPFPPALWGLLALMVLALAGCSSAPPTPGPSYLVLLPNADGTVGRVWVRGSGGTQELAQAGQGVPLDASRPPAPVDARLLLQDFGAALSAQPTLPRHFVLYFESGSTQLSASSRAMLPQIVESAAWRPSADVDISGHTDSVGSPELNEGLSLRRAQAVAELLRALGLKADALSLYAMGQRMPLVGTPHERPEPRNRRVEVTVR